MSLRSQGLKLRYVKLNGVRTTGPFVYGALYVVRQMRCFPAILEEACSSTNSACPSGRDELQLDDERSTGLPNK